MKGNIDVLTNYEAKVDNDSFPVDNFVIYGFSTPYQLDCNINDGGIMFQVREDIPSTCFPWT